MADLTIKELFNDFGPELALEWMAGQTGESRVAKVSEVNRPGLSLAGYMEYFRSERIQILGQGEYAYLHTLDNARRLATSLRTPWYSTMIGFSTSRLQKLLLVSRSFP